MLDYSYSKSHPEYLIAKRENWLIRNLVDVENPAYIAKEIIGEALEYIDQSLKEGRKFWCTATRA